MKNEIEIKLPQKFSSINFKKFIQDFWVLDSSVFRVIINFHNTEWITNEGKVLLVSYLLILKKKGILIFIKAPCPVSTELDQKESKLLANDWKLNGLSELQVELKVDKYLKYKINRRVDFYRQYFINWDLLNEIGLSKESIISNIEIDKKISFEEAQAALDIIPFQRVDCNNLIENNINFKSSERISESMSSLLQKITFIDGALLSILEKYGLNSPFQNKIISNVIANELILNVALHAFELNESKECFFAVDLNKPIKNYDVKRFKQNFSEERISEQYAFFANPKFNLSKKAFLEITFADFGKGISKTLIDQFQNVKKNKTFKSSNQENQILEFSFETSSSRNQFNENLIVHELVPRGLFFLLEIVKYYSGALLVRSNEGRILYDFSNKQNPYIDIENTNESYSFPGTIYNILLPDTNDIDYKSELKGLQQTNASLLNTPYVSKHLLIVDLQAQIKNEINNTQRIAVLIQKIDIYLDLLHKKQERSLVYLDFASSNTIFIDFKIFYYLCNTPKIDKKVQLIVINYPSEPQFLDTLSRIQKNIARMEPFLFKPIPCLFFGNKNSQNDNDYDNLYQIKWIGIPNNENQKGLNEILQHGIEKVIPASDFNYPEILDGNLIEVNWINKSKNVGNVSIYSVIPTLNEISFKNCLLGKNEIKYILQSNDIYSTTEELLAYNLTKNEHELVFLQKPYIEYEIFLKARYNQSDKDIFLTSGGYYQYSFIKFLDALNDEKLGSRFAKYLLNKYIFEKGNLPELDAIVSVTLSSSLLAKYVREEYSSKQGLTKAKKPKLIALAHYSDFQHENTLELLKKNDKVLLVNDVISTGNLVFELLNSIQNTHGASVISIFTIVDSRVKQEDFRTVFNNPQGNFKGNFDIYNFKHSLFDVQIESILVSLSNFKILKFENNPLHLTPIRINPIINSPEKESLSKSQTNSIFFYPEIEGILNKIEDKFLKIGYLKNNHHFHYYTIDTDNYFQTKKGIAFIRELIEKIASVEGSEKKYHALIYPLFSAVDEITKQEYRQEIFKNNNIEIFPIPRVNTDNGWRIPLINIFKYYTFPENTKLDLFIFDDGSCSGDTLIQLIDLVSFLNNVKSITVLSVFGRLEDYEREFFSRVAKIKTTSDSNENTEVDIKIYFATHLHIPFYNINNCGFLSEQKQIENYLKSSDQISPVYFRTLNKFKQKFEPTKVSDEIDFELLNVFPSNSDGSLPIKKIIILRNELGKIQGYRVFKEYFKSIQIYFDNKENLEILIGIVNHEPHLLTTIQNVIPDIYKKLQEIAYKIIKSKDFSFDSILEFKKISYVKFLSNILFSEFYEPSNFIRILKSLEESEESEDILELIHYILFQSLESDNYSHTSNLLKILQRFYQKNSITNSIFYPKFRHLYSKHNKKSDFFLRDTIFGFAKDLGNMHINQSHTTLVSIYNSVYVYLKKIDIYLNHTEDFGLTLEIELNNYIRELENYKSRIEIIKNFFSNHTSMHDQFLKFEKCHNDILKLERMLYKIIKEKDYSTVLINSTIANLDIVQYHFADIDTNIASFFRSFPVVPLNCLLELIDSKPPFLNTTLKGFLTIVKGENLKSNIYCEINKEFLLIIFKQLIINSQNAFALLENRQGNLEIEFSNYKDHENKSPFYNLRFKQNFYSNIKIESGLFSISETLKGFGGRIETINENLSLKKNEIQIVLRVNPKEKRLKT